MNAPDADDETTGNAMVQVQKKKSHPTARKSTSGRLNKTPVRDQEKEFCCIECNSLFLTPGKLFEHTRANHLLISSPNDDANKDDEEEDIGVLEVTQPNDKKRKRNLTEENNNPYLKVIPTQRPILKETYYYFCLDCEAERGNYISIYQAPLT